MTDEDDDERMERAKRIKRMREGNRPDDDGSDDDVTSAESADDGSTDEESAEQGVEEAVESADATGTEESGTAETGTDETAVEESVPADVETASPETPDLDADDDSISAPLPETDQLEEALDESDAGGETETVSPEVAETAAEAADAPAGSGELLEEDERHDKETRVLEFTLDDEHYCLDIEYIEEIVKEEAITRVPNTPDQVEGVVDLRGQITTILNPKVIIEKDDVSPGDLIVVFDSEAFEDQGHVGWVVDDVKQVSPISAGEVNDPPVKEDHVNGVIDRDDDEEFVIWTSPELAMETAE